MKTFITHLLSFLFGTFFLLSGMFPIFAKQPTPPSDTELATACHRAYSCAEDVLSAATTNIVICIKKKTAKETGSCVQQYKVNWNNKWSGKCAASKQTCIINPVIPVMTNPTDHYKFALKNHPHHYKGRIFCRYALTSVENAIGNLRTLINKCVPLPGKQARAGVKECLWEALFDTYSKHNYQYSALLCKATMNL